jgi:ribosomal protein L37AE/L43A
MPELKKYEYQNLKVSNETRTWLERIMSDSVYRYVPLRDVIHVAWPKCPACGGPLVQKLASQNVICAECRTEYALSHV